MSHNTTPANPIFLSRVTTSHLYLSLQILLAHKDGLIWVKFFPKPAYIYRFYRSSFAYIKNWVSLYWSSFTYKYSNNNTIFPPGFRIKIAFSSLTSNSTEQISLHGKGIRNWISRGSKTCVS